MESRYYWTVGPYLRCLDDSEFVIEDQANLGQKGKKLFEVHDVLFMDEKFFATKPPEGPAGVEKYFLTESNCKRT